MADQEPRQVTSERVERRKEPTRPTQIVPVWPGIMGQYVGEVARAKGTADRFVWRLHPDGHVFMWFRERRGVAAPEGLAW